MPATITADLPVADLIAAYAAGPDLVREAIAGMTPEQLQSRPIVGKMSSQEVVCHIVDSDQFIADRIKRTISTERPLLIGVESVDYLTPLHYSERDIALDLRLLELTREQLAADLRRVAPDAWMRTAVHSEAGLVTVRDQLRHAIEHIDSHLAAIGEKRAALGI
jgi:hypothetical protein